MQRFGGLTVQDRFGNAIKGRVLTVWTEEKSGQQLHNLLNWDGSALAELTSDLIGRADFALADDDRTLVWVETPDGDRWPVPSLEGLARVGRAVSDAALAYSAATVAGNVAETAAEQALTADSRAVEALQRSQLALESVGASWRVLSTPALLPKADPGATLNAQTDYQSWLSITALPSGAWIAANTTADDRDLYRTRQFMLRRSTDQGRTWTTTRYYWPDQGGQASVVGTSPDGAAVALFERRTDTIHELRVTRSGDDGQTWTTGATYSWPEIEKLGPIFTLSSGDMITNWTGATTRGLLRSTDNGATWTMEHQEDPDFNCARMIETGTGIVAVCHSMIMFSSTDNGVTWTNHSTARALPVGENLPAIIRVNEEAHLLYIDADALTMNHMESTVDRLEVDPTDWGEPQQLINIFAQSSEHISHPSLEVMATGDLFVGWHSGQGGQASLWSSILSGSAPALVQANDRAMTILSSFSMPAEQTITANTGNGSLMAHWQSPLFDIGTPWVRILGRLVSSTRVGRLRVCDQQGNVLAEVEAPQSGSGLSFDSGWRRVPRSVPSNYLALRGLYPDGGQGTFSSATTVAVGGNRA